MRSLEKTCQIRQTTPYCKGLIAEESTVGMFGVAFNLTFGRMYIIPNTQVQMINIHNFKSNTLTQGCFFLFKLVNIPLIKYVAG